MKIPLALWGTFSYFPTSKPTLKTLEANENVIEITPLNWNPHTDHWAKDEENMLDWEGNLVSNQKQRRFDLEMEGGEEHPLMVTSLGVTQEENTRIDACVAQDYQDVPNVPCDCDPHLLASALEAKVHKSKYAMAVGATVPYRPDHLIDDQATAETAKMTDEDSDSEEEDDDSLIEGIYEKAMQGQLDLDDIMISVTSAQPQDITPELLSKVWKIDHATAKRTLEVTRQDSPNTSNHPTLSKHYSTSDRMLRYKRINKYFYMDTFFATSKAKKSSRGHTCCQLFVSDRGFVYVVPMKSKGEVLQAVKQFAKEVGVPDAIIADYGGENISFDLKKFCSDIGTTLRILEENTPWANKAELYIGLIKEAVRRDMKDSNSPLVFGTIAWNAEQELTT